MRRAFLALAPIVLALAAVPAAAADGVWVGGTIHHLVTAPPKATQHPRPLYVIAPVSPSHPLHSLADALTHGFGAHDHVAQTVFTGPCDLILVVPAPRAATANVKFRMTFTPAGRKPLVYAARLDGRMAPLTSVARIARAEAAGLVVAVDTQTIISCTISGA